MKMEPSTENTMRATRHTPAKQVPCLSIRREVCLAKQRWGVVGKCRGEGDKGMERENGTKFLCPQGS